MSSLQFIGTRPLTGTIKPEGFKHAFVTTLAASFLSFGQVTFVNFPKQLEATTLLRLVESVGAKCSVNSESLTVTFENISGMFDSKMFDTIHGSVYLLPGLLAHTGYAQIRAAGGCAIGNESNGARPTVHYKDILSKFGAVVDDANGNVTLNNGCLYGTIIDLRDYTISRLNLTGPLYSGATKFAIMCAAISEGESEIRFPYLKADVKELLVILKKLGCSVEINKSKTKIYISRGALWSTPKKISYTLIPDLMQTLTWLIAGVITNGEVSVDVPNPDLLLSELFSEIDILRKMGFLIDVRDNKINLYRNGPVFGTDLVVHSHGVYSDAQPLFALLMSKANGKSSIIDTVWKNRFNYATELQKLGIKTRRTQTGLEIYGNENVYSIHSEVTASDLRSAVCLSLAAASVKENVIVHNIDHLDRGFYDFSKTILELGGSVFKID